MGLLLVVTYMVVGIFVAACGLEVLEDDPDLNSDLFLFYTLGLLLATVWPMVVVGLLIKLARKFVRKYVGGKK